MVGDLQLVAELVVPCDPEMLTVCRTTLAGVGAGLPLSDAALDDLKLVLSEVCGEAMMRAGMDGATIAIEFRTSSDEIEVSVTDRGPDRSAAHHGLGAPLLRRLCSRLEVLAAAPDPGTVVRFAQTLPG
jgi:anti-sigma regulatory factor (Ser/Thr protein kinase)